MRVQCDGLIRTGRVVLDGGSVEEVRDSDPGRMEHKAWGKGPHLLTGQGMQAGKAMVGDTIKLDKPRAEGLAEPLHYASDAGDVVIGGTDEGKKAFDRVLAQQSHPWGSGRSR